MVTSCGARGIVGRFNGEIHNVKIAHQSVSVFLAVVKRVQFRSVCGSTMVVWATDKRLKVSKPEVRVGSLGVKATEEERWRRLEEEERFWRREMEFCY